MRNIKDLFISLKQVEQSPTWHPEGSVWNHTVIVRHAAKSLSGKKYVYPFIAAMWHDVGKLTTTVHQDDGKITAHGHEEESLRLFFEYVPIVYADIHPIEIEAAAYLIKNHMRIKRFDEMREFKRQRIIDEGRDIKNRYAEQVPGNHVDFNPFLDLLEFRDWDTMVGRRNNGAVPNVFEAFFDSDVTGNKFINREQGFIVYLNMLQMKQNLWRLKKERGGTFDDTSS